MNKQVKAQKNRLYYKRLVYGLVACLIFLIILDPVQKIEVGQRGIIYNNLIGKVEESQLDDGWHFVIPFIEELTVYPISEQTYTVARAAETWLNGEDTSLWVPTSDRQRVGLDILFTYQFDKDSLKNIYERFQGKDIYTIESEFLDSWFRHAVISIVTQNSLYDVYSQKRSTIQDQMLIALEEKLAPLGINVESVLIKEVRLTPESEAILLAEARKEAEIISAMSKSEVNKLISQTLTEDIIRLQTLEKLSSNLKLVVVPGTIDNSLNLDSIINNLANETDGDNVEPDYQGPKPK